MIIAFVIFKCKKVFFSILVDNPNYFKQIFTCITKYRCSVSLGENEKKTKIFKRLLQTYILSFCIYGYADKKRIQHIMCDLCSLYHPLHLQQITLQHPQ
jgi:hypothetical protein